MLQTGNSDSGGDASSIVSFWTYSNGNDNGAERMRIDSSGNVGIGTSNPTSGISSTQTVLEIANGNVAALSLNNTAAKKFTIYSRTTNALAFHDVAAGADRLTLDTSGNLGLGVTPSAWDTAVFRTLQVGSGVGSASLSGRTDGIPNATLGVNVYYGTGAYRYIGNGTANYYNQQSGVHSWHTAASGTAGDPISFTQAATLDASGNFLVAATAVGNGGKLYVNGSISLGTSTTGAQSSMAKDTTQLTTSVSTSATTIYTDISSGMSSLSAGYFIVYGHNNSGAGFMDVVIAIANGTPVVISSSTTQGSPTARTYSVSSFALQLTMASGTFNTNVKATVLGHPF
jgi:hypothetical protein